MEAIKRRTISDGPLWSNYSYKAPLFLVDECLQIAIKIDERLSVLLIYNFIVIYILGVFSIYSMSYAKCFQYTQSLMPSVFNIMSYIYPLFFHYSKSF